MSKHDFVRLSHPLREGLARQALERAERFRRATELDLGSVLARFGSETEATLFAKDETQPAELRDDVIRALIAAFQLDPHEMWASCILAIFDKKLQELKVKFRDVQLDEAELAQILVCHALKVARTLNVANPRMLVIKRMAMYVEDSAWIELRHEKRHRLSRRGRSIGHSNVDPRPEDDEPADEGEVGVRVNARPHADAGPSVRVNARPPADEGDLSARVDARPPQREMERYHRVLEALKGRMSEADVALLTYSVETEGLLKDQFTPAAIAAAGDNPKEYKRRYEAAKRHRTRLWDRARKILRDAGLWEALGPEQAVPHLGI